MDSFNTSLNCAIGNAPDFRDIAKDDDEQNRGQPGGRSLYKTSCTAQCITGKLDDEKSRSLAQRECVHQGEPPLHIAGHQRRTDILQMLNEVGGDISNLMTTAIQEGNARLLGRNLTNTKLSQHALNKALREAAERGQAQCLEILITAGAKNLDEALRAAAGRGQTQCLTPLISKGAEDLGGALCAAAESGNTDSLLLLVNKGAQNLDDALYFAVLANNEKVKTALFVKGADISTILHTAARKDSIERLDDQTISAYIHATDKNGQTPLHIAAAKGHIKSLEKLIKTDGVNVNIADKNGWTPLHQAVRYAGIETLKVLLATDDIQVNKMDRNGQTALHLAIMYAATEKVQALLFADGINVNAKDNNLYTPLHLAVEYGRKDVVQLLLDVEGIKVNERSNADPDIYAIKNTPLLIAVKQGPAEIIELLLDHKDIDVNVKDQEGITAPRHAKLFKDRNKLFKNFSKRK